MAAKDAPVGMKLVDDHVPQVLEQLRPPGMVRQDARVQHVRVTQHEMRASTDRAARILRRVSVIGTRTDRHMLLQPRRQP